MKSRVFTGAAVAVALLLGFGSSASAGTITISDPGGSYRQGSGGEFTVKDKIGSGSTLVSSIIGNYAASATVGGGIETFCIEKDEFISLPGDYNAALSNGAIDGGVQGGNPDPISQGTAYLISRFAQGVLAGYNYTPGAGRAAKAEELQNAIWYLEQEQGADINNGPTAGEIAGNIFLQAVVAQYSTIANAMAADNGAQGVMAMNLTTIGNNNVNQDQAVYVPDGGTTLALLGMAMSGLAMVQRRNRRS